MKIMGLKPVIFHGKIYETMGKSMGKSMKPVIFPNSTNPLIILGGEKWGFSVLRDFSMGLAASTCLVPIEEPRFLDLILVVFFRAGRGGKQRAKFFRMKTILNWLVVPSGELT